MDETGWPDPPAYDVTPPRGRADLGMFALVLAASGPGLVLAGAAWTVASGYLVATPVYLAAGLAVPLAVAAGLVGAVALATRRGAGKGALALLASVPVAVLGATLALPALTLLEQWP